MADSGSIATIVSALAWPAVVVCALVILRSPLANAFMRVTNFRLVAGKVKLETVLAAQLPAEVAREVLRKPDKYLAPQRLEVTVLLTLVRGATGLTEDVGLDFIRAYQTMLADVVLKAGGTIDSISPTGIIAFWGAPIPSGTHADDACDAAVTLSRLSEGTKSYFQGMQGLPFVPRAQVVVTTAKVLAGELGPEQAPRYSILGEYGAELNGLAALAHGYAEPVLVTEFTQVYLRKHRTRTLAEHVRVKGKSAPISIYALEVDEPHKP